MRGWRAVPAALRRYKKDVVQRVERINAVVG
jgi:hypothetical protein